MSYIAAISALVNVTSGKSDEVVFLPTELNDRNQQHYLLDVTLNGVHEQELLPCIVQDQSVTLLSSVLQAYGIHDDSLKDAVEYIDLKAISHMHPQIDLAQQKLILDLPARNFAEKHIDMSHEKITYADNTVPGIYLNYDITTQNIHSQSRRSMGALTELVHFNRYGVGSCTGLLQHGDISNNAVRLETNWTMDQPDDHASLRFGDSITRPAMNWGAAARFAGIQWSTDFSMQPNFVTAPMPPLKGQSVLPSTVDVYVNDILALSKQVDRGPFLINNMPVADGAGNINLITQDILGRRQETVLPYYVSSDLLKTGLQDFSLETGFLRYDYGVRSNHYQDPMASATYRRGLTNFWTGSAHTELSKRINTVGFDQQFLLGHWGTLSVTTAGSVINAHQATNKMGKLWGVGFKRQAKAISFGFNVQATNYNFVTLNTYSFTSSPRLSTQVYASYSFENYGVVNLTYTERRIRAQQPLRLLTLNYQYALDNNWHMYVYGSYGFRDRLVNQVGFMLTWRIADDKTAQSNSFWQKSNRTQWLSLRKTMTVEQDYGYNVLATAGSRKHYEAEYDKNSSVGDYVARVSQDQNKNNLELNTRGSIIRFGEQTVFSRSIHESFGLIQTSGVQDVTIYHDNRPIGTTDQDGKLFIPNMKSYQYNKITMDVRNLPMNYTFNNSEMNVVPRKRSGVSIPFNVEPNRIINFKVTDSENNPLNPGTVLHEKNSNRDFIVGYEGEVCLDISDKYQSLELIAVIAPSCTVNINLPQDSSAFYQLDTQTCLNRAP